MTLRRLIELLEQAPQERVVRNGFDCPHSYRGYYDQLAFEPAQNVTIASMTKHAKESLGKTFAGYKGGEYKMGEYTDVWLAEYGCTGDMMGELLIKYMIADAT